MSEYVYGSGISYNAYLQLKSLNDDVVWEISNQTLEHVATREELLNLGAAVRDGFDEFGGILDDGLSAISDGLERVDETLQTGFAQLHFDLKGLNRSVNRLSAQFDWAHEQTLAALGRVNDAIDELLRVAKTPEQIWAFEQFEAARDCYRRQLFPEALEHVERAINGYIGHPGSKTEPRFHAFLGKLRLGDRNNLDGNIIDLAVAETSFALAARYARHDNPKDAANAFLHAGWAAYCQGRFIEALEYSKHAASLDEELAQAHFQLAKIHFRHRDIGNGLRALGTSISCDSLYALKWDDDDEFRPHSAAILALIDSKKEENANSLGGRIESASCAVAQLGAEILKLDIPNWASASLRFKSTTEKLANMLNLCTAAIANKSTYLSVASTDQDLDEVYRLSYSMCRSIIYFADWILPYSAWLSKHCELEKAENARDARDKELKRYFGEFERAFDKSFFKSRRKYNLAVRERDNGLDESKKLLDEAERDIRKDNIKYIISESKSIIDNIISSLRENCVNIDDCVDANLDEWVVALSGKNWGNYILDKNIDNAGLENILLYQVFNKCRGCITYATCASRLVRDVTWGNQKIVAVGLTAQAASELKVELEKCGAAVELISAHSMIGK